MPSIMDSKKKPPPKDVPSGRFSHPVFKHVSEVSDVVNEMSEEIIRSSLSSYRLSTIGTRPIVTKRLITHMQYQMLKDAEFEVARAPYKYYIIIDFEATCDENRDNFKPEIIEFPAVAVNSSTFEIDYTFHQYVRPVINPVLTEYCRNLTHIKQHQVDKAATFPHVLDAFEKWLNENSLIGQSVIVTDGPHDLGKFLYHQVKLCNLPYPEYAKRWVNVKRWFTDFYNCGGPKPTISVMLEHLGMSLEGQLHSGIEDAKNIARIAVQLLKDGCLLTANELINLDIPYLPNVFVF